jgi:PhnB protein
MTTIGPHINFNGNALEAFGFYKGVFGSEFSRVTYLKDLATAEFPVSDEDKDKLMYIALPVAAGSVLSGNDVPSFLGKTNERENRSKIAVSTESKEEADRIFAGLSAGGEVEVPMSDSPWGSYFGMFRDKYGIEWMINYEKNS